MGVYLLHDVAQWAGATAVLAALGCLIAGVLAVQLSASVLLPGDEAFALARAMGVLGGVSVLVAGASCTLYYWMVGVASGRATVLVESGMIGGAAVFAVLLHMLAVRHGARAPR
jgi:hypothetical protein